MEKLTDELVQELINKKADCACCRISFLSGFILAGGEFVIKEKKPCIIVKPKNKNAILYVENLIKTNYNASVLNGVVDEFASARILHDCEFVSPDGRFKPQISEETFVCENCAGYFLRGVFLECGRASVKFSADDLTVSTGSGYKIIFNLNGILVSEFAQLLAQFDVDVSVVENIAYISGFENVRTFLGIVDASQSLLKLENENIARSLRAQSNRAVNATEGNIKKTVAMNGELVAAVKAINDVIGCDKLPEHLRAVCKIVLQNDSLNLSEIAAKLSISKSGANHRVRSIRQIYKTLV